ncbi:MAG: DUF2867 domain-containing protein [Thermoleophilaceae bacterium]|nr:DUF2867 domain-containing protein [Thermoleophilaceae bacterium]
MRQRRVAVIGATGYVGGRLLDRLVDDGFEVAALARTPAKLASVVAEAEGAISVYKADVQDVDSLAEGLEGAEAAFYLVHSLGEGASFVDDDTAGARNFARACERAGVGQIIYLSGLGAEGGDLSEHLSSRHATGDALREGSVPVTELRAAIVVGSGSASFEIVRDLARKLPVMVAPKWVSSRCEPIGIRDVVSYLVGTLDEPRTIGQTLDIGCGEVLTYRRMMEICAEEQGRRCLVITVPVLTPRLSSYWLHLVTSVDMKIARPLIEGLRNDVVTQDHRIREWIDFEPADYRTSVSRALDRELGRTRRESRWTDAGLPAKVRPSVKAFTDSRRFDTALPPEELFRRVSRIGGGFGYGRTADILWKLRGLIDRIGGGPGLRRGRPFGGQLHTGDVVDFWRVVESKEPERLELVAEMRVPGEARLVWTIEPTARGSVLVQTATLTNESLLSGIYWYLVAPAHNWVFNRMALHLMSD